MRAKEFISENASAGATVSGSIAPIAQPLGQLISRMGLDKTNKYSNRARSLQTGKKKHVSR